jgi:hypothetical protein
MNPDLQNQTEQLLVWLKAIDNDLQVLILCAICLGVLLFLFGLLVFIASIRRRRS